MNFGTAEKEKSIIVGQEKGEFEKNIKGWDDLVEI